MALFLQHKEPGWLLGIWKMEESLDEVRHALDDEPLWQHAQRAFASPHRRLEWLSVRLLLFRLLGERKEIAYLPSGKPYLADGSAYISISHTKGYVALLVGDSPVSIDIEHYSPRVHRVASRFLRADEQVTPYQGDLTWGLLLHWSAKEVLFKSLEQDEVDLQRHLRIERFDTQEVGLFRAYEYRTEAAGREYAICYRLFPDFVLTWWVTSPGPWPA